MARRTRQNAPHEPDWLTPDPHVIEGIDHLGTQIVSVNLYGLLLPGISNVTDRARYFAIYPWAIHTFARAENVSRTKHGWYEHLRRIDFAYALASAASESVPDEEGGQRDTNGVVGIDRARKILKGLKGDEVELSPHTQLDDKLRPPAHTEPYFRNVEGGYRQYYKGPLTILGALLDEEAFPLDRKLTTYAGAPLAECIEATPAFGDLLAIAAVGRATVDELARVGRAVEPGAIPTGSAEQRLLRGLLLGDDDALCRGQIPAERAQRRASLALMLHFARDAGAMEAKSFVWEFRWGCTARALPSGDPWAVPAEHAKTAEAWGAYHRNDTLSYALEAIFWAALDRIGEGPPRHPRDVAAELAQLACEAIEATEESPAQPALAGTVAQWAEQCRRLEGAGGAWDETSTYAWWLALSGALRDGDPGNVARWSARLLGRLITDRGAFASHPFESIPGAAEMAEAHGIHLGTWYERTRERAQEDVREFLAALALEWVLFRHLRVATRKLANQGASTFRFRPDHGRCVLTETNRPYAPTFTNPRLEQAVAVLHDIGLLVREDGDVQLTPDGAAWVGGAA